MPATVVNEVYLGETGATISLGTVACAVIDGKYTVEVQVDEMTNNTSAGWYEDVQTIKKANGDMTLAFKTGSPPGFIEGNVYALVISIPSGPGISGNARLVSRDFPGVDPKKGVKLGVKWTSQGAMAVSNG